MPEYIACLALAEGSSVIDTALFNELVELMKSLLNVFTIFPLNVFLIAGFIGIGFGIFRQAKKSVRR